MKTPASRSLAVTALLSAFVLPAMGDSSSVTQLATRIQYVDVDNQPLPTQFYSLRITLLFPYIPGQIFGNPQGAPLFVAQPGSELEFGIDLAAKTDAIETGAIPLREGPATKGLSIQPASTALARMGTFAFDTATGQELGGGGFVDAATRESLILIYVSQACSISGTVAAEGTLFEHDIRLPSSGFHWIRVSLEPNGRYRLRHHPADSEVYFSIHLFDLGRT